MASCHCVTVTQRRCRTAKGTLGRSCSGGGHKGKRKGRCLKTKVTIQDYGPAKRRCVKRAKR